MGNQERERNQKIVKLKKKQTLERTGKLVCEVCSFDFKKVYGVLGEDFCEIHHLIKLADAEKQVETTLSDLAVVCSNCHRILHRDSPMKTLSQLKNIVLTGSHS